jgi:hypothetical protein
MFSNINLWKTMLLGQSTALNAQTDSRSTQSAQNTTALANVNTALSVINPWISSPSYTSGGLSSISSELATRQSFIPTRITQITTALGNVTVSGNTFSSSDLTSPYYNRYKWLDVRIDIASGSARRYFAMNQSIAIINGLIANNNALYTDYSGYFTTKALTSNDGSDILFVTDLTGLSNGDSINIISETLTSPVPLSIVKLMGTTQVQVNQPVPISYTVQDKARIYKAL